MQLKVYFISLFSFSASVFAGSDERGLNPNSIMVIIMYICFFIILIFGSKFAWKPILSKIDEREKVIKQALDDAEETKKKLADIKRQCKVILHKANDEARVIVVDARELAEKLAIQVREKSQNEANAQKEKAFAEIETQKIASIQVLRKESAELAIAIAGKILDKNLDNDMNHSLVDKFIKKI